MITPSLRARAVLASLCLLLPLGACKAHGQKSGNPPSAPPKPDLIVTSASLKLGASLGGPGAWICSVEVTIKNNGHAPIERADLPFVVRTRVTGGSSPGSAGLGPTLESFGSWFDVDGSGVSASKPVEFVVDEALDVGQSKTLHATGVFTARGATDIGLVVAVDACSTGDPCKIDEEDETNNFLIVLLGNIGRSP